MQDETVVRHRRGRVIPRVTAAIGSHLSAGLGGIPPALGRRKAQF